MPVRLATLSDLPALAEALRGAARIAIDTEFHAEHRWLPELYLVQLRIPGGDTWIVDPLVDGLLAGIAEPLRRVTWLVHGGEQDLRVMQPLLGGLPDEVLDTQVAAALLDGMWPAPYAALVERWLGQRIDKGETLSDWSRRPLTAAQLAYAAQDVELLPPLWERLEAELVARGRLDVARAACAEARRVALEPPSDDEAFRAIGAAASLEGAQLAVLQELAAWREQRARATNQPTRSILGDAALVELARRQPATVESIVANRRVPRSVVKNADELVERIARAAARPPEAWPPCVRRRSPEARLAALLQVFATTIGERERFAAGLVLPRDLAEAIALARPATRDGLRDLLGWRDALLGDALWDVLSGETVLRVDPGTRDVSVERAPRGGSRSA